MAVENLFSEMCAASLVSDIGPAVPEPAFVKYRANRELHTRNMEELLAHVREFLLQAGFVATITIDDLNAYYNAMAHNRAFGVPGTTPGNGTMWLFLLTRVLKPSLIVESGVYGGSSLFTLRAAAPQAKMIAYDITFKNLVERLPGVDYRERDWGGDELRAESPSDLCFFDDHTNNCRRVRQSF
jgi:hypothetical protein